MYLNSVVILCILVAVAHQVSCAGNNNNNNNNYEVDYETNFEYQKNSQNSFDYIVVGVGQSGSVAAAR